MTDRHAYWTAIGHQVQTAIIHVSGRLLTDPCYEVRRSAMSAIKAYTKYMPSVVFHVENNYVMMPGLVSDDAEATGIIAHGQSFLTFLRGML